jgi:hypothetical protein
VTFVLEGELAVYRDVIAKIDGSSPVEAAVDVSRFLTQNYAEISRKVERLKVRTGKKTGHPAIPEGDVATSETEDDGD